MGNDLSRLQGHYIKSGHSDGSRVSFIPIKAAQWRFEALETSTELHRLTSGLAPSLVEWG